MPLRCRRRHRRCHALLGLCALALLFGLRFVSLPWIQLQWFRFMRNPRTLLGTLARGSRGCRLLQPPQWTWAPSASALVPTGEEGVPWILWAWESPCPPSVVASITFEWRSASGQQKEAWTLSSESDANVFHRRDPPVSATETAAPIWFHLQVPQKLREMSEGEYRWRIEQNGILIWQQASWTPVSVSISPVPRDCPTCTMRYLVVSDNQYAADRFLQVLLSRNQIRPQFVVHAGDAVQQGSDASQWSGDFLDVLFYAQLNTVPLVYIPGNHDNMVRVNSWDVDIQNRTARDLSTNLIEYNHPLQWQGKPLWYAMTIGPIRWILLNSQLDCVEQEQWLEKELASNTTQQAPYRIVLSHIPPYLEYWAPEQWPHEKHWGRHVRSRYVPLFERYRVDWVISGHQHRYQRGAHNGIMYTILGGGGGELDLQRVHQWHMYEKDLAAYHAATLDILPGDTLWWRVWSLDDEILDEWRLTKNKP